MLINTQGLTPEKAKAIFAELFQDGSTPYQISESLQEIFTFAMNSNDADSFTPAQRGNLLTLLYQLNKLIVAAHTIAEPVN